jgi:hypothetical protein
MREKVYSVKVRIKGIRPLLQNDPASMSVETSGKSKKVYEPKDEAEIRLIKDNDQLCQKAIHLESAMVKQASNFKYRGKKTYKDLFNSAVFIDPILIPHENQNFVIDSQGVVIGRARVIRHRPRFDEWALSFQINVFSEEIPHHTLKEVLAEAGSFTGIGDHRPRYGLFEIIEWEVVK